jgi:hypothetical protein
MSRTHLRASLSAFVVVAAIAVATFFTTTGDAQSDTAVAAAEVTDPAADDLALDEPGAPTPPADSEQVVAEAQRTEQLRAHEAELARYTEALAAAEQDAALRALAQAEREAQAGIPDAYWDRMAQCETAGDWSMVGSRYSGGLGFYNGTWDAFGGREFAAKAGQATREQQIVVANRVANEVGLSGWGCLDHVGRP